MMSKLC